MSKAALFINDKEILLGADNVEITVRLKNGAQIPITVAQLTGFAEMAEAADVDRLILALLNEHPQLKQKVDVIRKGVTLREEILSYLNSPTVSEEDLKKYKVKLDLYESLRGLDSTLLDQIKNIGGLASTEADEAAVERGAVQNLLKKTKNT